MSRLLYIFPHPDDESFGPAAAMHNQLKNGDEVFLLTLTKGEATKQRHRYNMSKDEMGEQRYKEMKNVEKELGLTGMKVLDFPDDNLCELDPRPLENAVREEINRIQPDVIVSYNVYGVSGFDDHLVAHAIVKRVFVEIKEKAGWDKLRLAFFVISKEQINKKNPFFLKASKKERIDCVISISNEDVEAMLRCLDCYETYQDVIEKTGVRESFSDEIAFEIFGENFDLPLKSLT